MSYHLETIPVWDAIKESPQCPLCHLHLKKEADYVANFLGGSVMEPDTRIAVNDKYFCSRHVKMLYEANNRLGLALMTHTHMQEKMGDLLLKDLDILQKSIKAQNTPWFSKKTDPYRQAVERIEKHMTDEQHNCILCERLTPAMESYVYTLIYLYENDGAFAKAFHLSKGYCLPHFTQILQQAGQQLQAAVRNDFIRDLIKIQKENLTDIIKDLEWFTLKFDYRNKEKPWGNAQNALPRTINQLKGPLLPVQPNKPFDEEP